ncbi:MAG: UDP-2,4-diacetamido-2,4,6-trideoxy-beta-L-altropyranose hydrolase [Acidobacteriia bacterium]|nr:UDP-2,4-diacetamido-2,4,6-trideoxy-beta-L-altropyranose hydrolase [Terriglobia bacterium]
MVASTLIIRADASVAMGTGHVMRCLALAQTWQDAGGDVAYAMAESRQAIAERLQSERIKVIAIRATSGTAQDAQETIDAALVQGADWIVVDGYQFNGEYQKQLKAAGRRVLFLDDTGHAAHYSADLVLNQNAHAHPEIYVSREGNTRLLLGSRYAMLRREFASWRDFRRKIPPVGHKVLVTMGGSDPENLTLRAIQALALIDDKELEATVVVGGSNPHLESLREAAGKPEKAIRVVSDADNMPEMMAWADVAVSAAGSTCWEMCFLGLPSILIDFAPNQTPVAKELDRLGAAVHLGNVGNAAPRTIADRLQWLLASREERASMSQRAARLVDGRGAGRVFSAMQIFGLHLRRVEEKDCRLLWEWINDPEVRAASFSCESIPWEQHVEWFASKLADPNAILYLATDAESVPLGHVRYQIEGAGAVVSIDLAAGFRGRGFGGMVLAMATEELFRKSEVNTIHAYVKPDNHGSLRLFSNANFLRRGCETIHGQQAIHFVLERNGVL